MTTKLTCTLTAVTAILLSGLRGQVAWGAARHATVVVHEKFGPRYGMSIEGFGVYLEVTRVWDSSRRDQSRCCD